MQEQQNKWLLKVKELFFQVGIKSVTMDHIAAALGISKKTLYQWVPNKAALVNLLMDNFIEQDRCVCAQAATTAQNALEELMFINRHTLHDIGIMKSNIVFDIKHYYPESWDKMLHYQRNYILDVVCQNLRRGMAEGLYRTDLVIDLTARLHGQQIFSLFDEDWFPTQQFARVHVIQEFMKCYAYGITSETGRKYLDSHWN
jgi:TetR/AcrR family transcriptional regulator, cholesterol catabolism regulator